MEYEYSIASVRVEYDSGKYVTTISWDKDFKAWKSESGFNQHSRVPQLDTASPEGIGYFVTDILKRDPVGVLEFLWPRKNDDPFGRCLKCGRNGISCECEFPRWAHEEDSETET